jgi:hypothetical protein
VSDADPAPLEAPPAEVWVLDTSSVSLDRVERLARKLGRRGAALTPLGSRWCVGLPEGVDRARWKRRAERRLGAEVEVRANCDVAWFPLGRGYAAVLVGAPGDGVETWLDRAGLPYREVRRPSDPDQVVRVCVPLAALPSTVAFAEDLRAAGYDVQGMYEVGGCYR